MLKVLLEEGKHAKAESKWRTGKGKKRRDNIYQVPKHLLQHTYQKNTSPVWLGNDGLGTLFKSYHLGDREMAQL